MTIVLVRISVVQCVVVSADNSVLYHGNTNNDKQRAVWKRHRYYELSMHCLLNETEENSKRSYT